MGENMVVMLAVLVVAGALGHGELVVQDLAPGRSPVRPGSQMVMPKARSKIERKVGESLPGAGAGNYECPDKKCKHGGSLQSCKCICTNGWGGVKCEFCRIAGGSGRRLLAIANEADQSLKKKKKKKKPPSLGSCKNGSLEKKSCSCKCTHDWTGLFCNVCKHAPCKNGGHLDKSACRCVCPGNWVGKFCETCSISGNYAWKSLFDPFSDKTPKKCHHGQLNAGSCSCKCDPDWTGNLCESCSHAGCGVAGELNKLY